MNKYVRLIVHDYLARYERGGGSLGFTAEQVEEIKNELYHSEEETPSFISTLLKAFKFSH